MNPFRLTLGLADAVESWGVRIYENTKVVKLEKKDLPLAVLDPVNYLLQPLLELPAVPHGIPGIPGICVRCR